jgi:predicted oxidoreductase
MVKMTFTVDEETVDILRRTAAQLKKPQSAVFREAIRNFAQRMDRLSDEQREQKLAILRRMRARKPTRTRAAVDAEIAAIRAARRTGGRRTPAN